MQPCDRELLINIATILLPISGLFFWGRTEANADRRDLTQKLEANSKETRAAIDSHAKESRQVIRAIQAEMKDFHKKLYDLQCKKRRR